MASTARLYSCSRYSRLYSCSGYRSAVLSLWQKTHRRATCTAKDALITCIINTRPDRVPSFRDEIHQSLPLLCIELYSKDDSVGWTSKHCCWSSLMYRKNSGIPKELEEAMKAIRIASVTPATWTDHLSDIRQRRYSSSPIARWCPPTTGVLHALHRQITI